jgi:hypothetical protein
VTRSKAVRLSGRTSKHEPSRRERKPVNTNAKDQSGDQLDTEGDSPSSIGLARVSRAANIVGSVSNPVRDEDTD